MASVKLAGYFQPKTPKTPMIVITGDAGVGKTTLAATFPSPLFIKVEDGTTSIDQFEYAALPAIKSVCPEDSAARGDITNIHKALRAILLSDDLPADTTVVIDSITTLEQKIQEYIVSTDAKATSMATACGGFGKAYVELARRMRDVFNLCREIADTRGFPIVFLAHAQKERISPPDGEEYTRFSLQLHEKVRPPFTNEVDLLGYLTLHHFMKGGTDGTRKRAISSGERVLRCETTIVSDAKNRYGIVQDIPIPYGVNPLLDVIPFFSGKQADHGKAATPVEEDAEAPEFQDAQKEQEEHGEFDSEEPAEDTAQDEEKPKARRKTAKTTKIEDKE